MKNTSLLILLIGLLLFSGCSMQTAEPTPTITPEPTQSPLVYYEQGKPLLDQGNFTHAAELFQQAVDVDPEFGAAYSALAISELWAGFHTEAALDHASTAVTFDPEDAYAQAVLAAAQVAQGMLDEAVGSAQMAYQLDPADSFIQMMYVDALTADHQYEKAWQVINEIYPQNHYAPETFAALGNYFTAVGDFGYAESAYLQAVSLDSGFPVWQLLLVRYYFSSSLYDQAFPIVEELLEGYPEYLPALALRAEIEIGKLDYSAAQQTIGMIKQLDPDLFYADYLSGQIAVAQEDYAAALELLLAAQQDAPENLAVASAVGQVYLTRQECDLAQEVFTDEASTHPDSAVPLVGLGYAHLCSGDLDAAVEDFEQAQRIDRFSEEALFGMADAYLELEDYQRAEDALLAALSYEPAAAEVHFALGDLFLAQGELYSAFEEVGIGLELDPYNIDGYIQLAGILFARYRVEQALEVIDTALELAPENQAVRRFQGFLLYLDGRPDAALERIEESLQADPQNYTLQLFKALALRDLGDYPQALEALNLVVEQFSDDAVDSSDGRSPETLAQALAEGYVLSREEGLDLILAELSVALGYSPVIEILEQEGSGEVLAVELTIGWNAYNTQDYLNDLLTASLVISRILPRIQPVVEYGLAVEVKIGFNEMLLANLELEDMQRYFDTLYSEDDLAERIAFDIGDTVVRSSSIGQIIADVAGYRDLHYEFVPRHQVITQEQLMQGDIASVDEEYLQVLLNELSRLSLLGLASPDFDIAAFITEYYGSGVAGYYSMTEEKVYVVGDDQFKSYDQYTLAHECEHAIIDQVFNLSRVRSRVASSDHYLATTALIEGDAVYISYLYLYDLIPEMGVWSSGRSESEAFSEAIADFGYPTFLSDMSSFPYDYGVDFIRYLYDLGGWGRVNRAMGNPPTSSEQIMHPEKYILNEAPVSIDLGDPSAILGVGWEVVDQDVMGEYGVYLTLEYYFGAAAAQPAAAGWGGDRYLLLENDNQDDSIFIWRIAWDNVDEAQEFWDSLTDAMRHREGYSEVVYDFLGTGRRVWRSTEGYYLTILEDDQVTLLIGEELGDLDLLVGVLP